MVAGATLTTAQRSCLLRAARKHLEHLHEDYIAFKRYEDQKRWESATDMLFEEISCVTQAISWLWRQPAID